MSVEQDGIVAVQRLRFTFGKQGPARYISHLELARTLERTINRSRIPVAFSQGFNRRPRMSLAAALPLGYTSEAELADIWLVEQTDPDEVLTRLTDRAAPGISLTGMIEVPLEWPSLQQSLLSAEYYATFLDVMDNAALQQGVAKLLSEESLPRERKRAKDKRPKPYDLRPLILDLGVESDDGAGSILTMHLVQTPIQTGRPDEVLSSLGIDPLDAHVHRTRLYLDDNQSDRNTGG